VADKGHQKERDWDQEMAQVDRLLSKLPTHEPPPAPRPAGRGAVAGEGGERRLTMREWLGTWVRVGLGVVIGIAITQWPYAHSCGLRLDLYLLAVSGVIAAGVWSSISSWKRRLAVAHTVSQLLVIWGVLLGSSEIFPRVSAGSTATWSCPSTPAGPAPAAPASPTPTH
jgi:hypothetical protein